MLKSLCELTSTSGSLISIDLKAFNVDLLGRIIAARVKYDFLIFVWVYGTKLAIVY